MTELRECSKNCIANANGKCAVAECGGPIFRLHHRTDRDAVDSAKLYEMAKKTFQEEFGEEAVSK